MYIKDWMTRDPIVVAPDTPILEAQKLMQTNRIRRLPVVDRNKLVGIVTYRDIIEATPSDATTLSIHELNYLISKLTVDRVMTKNVVTAEPDETIEEAAMKGHRSGVGALPVLDRGKLVGIATEADIFRGYMALLGARENLDRVSIEDVDLEQGTIRKLCEIVEDTGAVVVSMISIPQPASDLRRVIVRSKSQTPGSVEKALKAAGYVIHR